MNRSDASTADMLDALIEDMKKEDAPLAALFSVSGDTFLVVARGEMVRVMQDIVRELVEAGALEADYVFRDGKRQKPS